MKSRNCKKASFFIIFFVIFFFVLALHSPTFAQQATPASQAVPQKEIKTGEEVKKVEDAEGEYIEEAKSASGAGSARKDLQTIQKFRRTSPGKIDALDSKLAEALMLYYDGRYGQALPIFNQISAEVQTTDIMWWIGTSAMNTGNLDLAVQKFKQMLEVDPNLPRVRLELAATYFQMGKYKEARQELATVKASKPPEEVVKNIDRLLATIDEATKKLSWNLRVSFGIQSDNNVSAGASNPVIHTDIGPLTLMQDSRRVSDTGYVTNLGANVLYKFLESPTGPAWNTTFDYYSVMYNKYSQYDYLMLDFTTGPWWIGRNFVAKLPVGYMIQYFGDADKDSFTTSQWSSSQVSGYLTPSEWVKRNFSLGQDNSMNRLSYITHIDPSFEYFFNQYFSLKGAFTYIRETYAKKWSMDTKTFTDQNQFDQQTRRYEITPNFYLFNRQHILSFTGGYENSDADARINTFDNKYYAVSYFMRFPTNTELFLKFQRNYKNYKDIPIMYTYDRYDTRNMYTAVLSQNFLKHYFASIAYTYIDNSSNASIYSYDKRTVTFSIGAYF